jgi:hypothetical protein
MTTPDTLPWLLSCLLLSPLGALFMVAKLKHHIRFGNAWTIDADWAFPGISRGTEVAKLTLKFLIPGALLALGLVLAWRWLGIQWAVPVIPDLAGLDSLRNLPDQPGFWQLTGGWILLLVLLELARTLRRPLWDLFISYKSEDTPLVRQIAERLMASGVKVWLADYHVLLRNWERFQEAINHGIDHSHRALVFTNNGWAGSSYCREEADRILKRISPSRIVEIMVPRENKPHELYPKLAEVPSIQTLEAETALGFLAETTGLSVGETPPAAPSTPMPHEMPCLGGSLTLDIAGWKIRDPGEVRRISGHPTVEGLELELVDSSPPMVVNLHLGPELSRPGQRGDQGIDDREMFKYLLRYAPGHFDRLRAAGMTPRLRGLHLVFHQGLSHMALTYRLDYYWSRKYSIIVPRLGTDQMAEFLFTFGSPGTFAFFLRRTAAMDRLVTSLVWT